MLVCTLCMKLCCFIVIFVVYLLDVVFYVGLTLCLSIHDL